MAASIGSVAIAFVRRVILAATKKLVRKFLMSSAPEMVDVAKEKKSPKQALKNIVTKPARKQVGDGCLVFTKSERHQPIDCEEESQ